MKRCFAKVKEDFGKLTLHPRGSRISACQTKLR